jgi:effector-binding domain-containing protein
MPVCEIDLRVGGSYRYVWRNESSGTKMGMGGVFREIVRPQKLVATEMFDEPWYPGEALDTTTFEERGGITKVTVTVRYESKDARDTAARSGMEHGMAAGYNRLEELLSATAPGKANSELIDTPVITETVSQLVASIHMSIPRSEMRSVMAPGLNEIMTAVKAQAIGPAGPWFDHHLKIDPEVFDFEICVPVSGPVTSVGRVVGREVPAVRVAQTIYGGPYENLGAAWGEFDAWMKANGHVPAADLYQCYELGPESSPNPADWRTRLRRPLLA